MRYIPKWFIYASVLLVTLYFSNLHYKTDILYFFQFILSVSAAYLFYKRNNRLLSIGLIFILIADLNYYLENYKLQLTSDSLSFFLSVNLIYSLGFIFISLSIHKRFPNLISLFQDYKISLIPIVTLLTASISYLYLPTFINLKGAFNYNGLGTITELSASMPLIIISFAAIILSPKLEDTFLFIGALLIGLVDWGIQFEFVSYGSLLFSYYDFFWFFGILLMFSRAKAPLEFFNFSHQKQKSIRIQLKIFLLIASILPVGIYSYIDRSNIKLGIGFFLIGAAASLLASSIFVQNLTENFKHLTNEIEQIFKGALTQNELKSNEPAYLEWEETLTAVVKNRLLIEKKQENIRQENMAKKTELAFRVAHDIRSPLAALQVAMQTDHNHENSRKLILGAISRIKTIAEDLLLNNNKAASHESFDIVQAINQIVEEKNFMGDEQIIYFSWDNSFSVIGDKSKFQRAISNFINNSLESADKKRSLSIQIEINQNDLFICDTGSGMSVETLQKLKAGDLKSTKTFGFGIGFKNSVQFLQELGFAVDVQSSLGEGTKIKISLTPETNHAASEVSLSLARD